DGCEVKFPSLLAVQLLNLIRAPPKLLAPHSRLKHVKDKVECLQIPTFTELFLYDLVEPVEIRPDFTLSLRWRRTHVELRDRCPGFIAGLGDAFEGFACFAKELCKEPPRVLESQDAIPGIPVDGRDAWPDITQPSFVFQFLGAKAEKWAIPHGLCDCPQFKNSSSRESWPELPDMTVEPTLAIGLNFFDVIQAIFRPAILFVLLCFLVGSGRALQTDLLGSDFAGFLGFKAAASFLALAIFTVLCPFSHSKHFCRFYLKAARTVNGATAWVPDDIMRLLQGKGYLIPGFTSSFSAQRPEVYLPESFHFPEDCDGVQAPVLWRLPFFAPMLRMWDCCTPATKENMKKLLAAKTAFGIIPGGSEDVAIHEHGKENVYINSRYGFIKYALQHGYRLVIAYTFGENDQYYSLSCLRPLNLWLVKTFGFVVPVFWGKSFFPLLPRGGGLNTVYGRALQLPMISDPTLEDLVHWHGIYVDALHALFNEYKHQFGFGDRELRCF
ncbi:DGA1, partial [Symbiodinium pilosum]